jgi:hypothetical protein
MPGERVGPQHEEIVRNYFTYIKQLRSGDQRAVDKLVDLWDKEESHRRGQVRC